MAPDPLDGLYGKNSRYVPHSGQARRLEEARALRMIAARCVSTVLGLMLRTLAICLFVQPSAINCTIAALAVREGD